VPRALIGQKRKEKKEKEEEKTRTQTAAHVRWLLRLGLKNSKKKPSLHVNNSQIMRMQRLTRLGKQELRFIYCMWLHVHKCTLAGLLSLITPLSSPQATRK
jgi:hypothetical protein